MTDIELSFTIYSSNINSIVSIYNDSEQIRLKKVQEFHEKLKIKTWTDKDFKEYSHYLHHFDWLLMQSLFISGFSYFESYMRSVAESIEKIKDDKVKIKDIKGNGYLDTYRKYIYLIGDINSANNDQTEWKTILEFKEVRNIITHERGEVKRKIKKAIEHDIFYGPGEDFIRIKKIKFLEDFVGISTKYMKLIADEIKQKKYHGN